MARGAPEFVVEKLTTGHDRVSFSCGLDSLDSYLKKQAGQDMRRRVAVPYVLVPRGRPAVVGYYTLSALGIRLQNLPPPIAAKLPRYPIQPVVLLGRLALDQRYQGQGLGEYLLLDALRRSLHYSAEIAAMAVVVDVINDAARRFYERYDFRPLLDETERLFVTMKTVERLFR